ncbi:MAG: host attachment protein [Nitrospirota bacterium]|nr:MAG: host attachment protein [Nitrospirota bacterium]
MKRVIIVADMGHFKAFKVTKEPMESERIEMIECFENEEAQGRMREKVSDSAGKFGLGGGKGGVKGYGEPHNMQLETKKRTVKSLAKCINDIIHKEDLPSWYLAAGKKINKQIVDSLSPKVKLKMAKNLASDLTKVRKSELLDHFENA